MGVRRNRSARRTWALNTAELYGDCWTVGQSQLWLIIVPTERRAYVRWLRQGAWIPGALALALRADITHAELRAAWLATASLRARLTTIIEDWRRDWRSAHSLHLALARALNGGTFVDGQAAAVVGYDRYAESAAGPGDRA